MTIFEEIKAVLDHHKYKWRINGELQTPTVKDIEQTLDEAVRLLSNEDSTNSSPQLEIGGIIIQHNGNHYDVYVRIGEIKTKETS